MGRSWQENKLRIEDRLDQNEEDIKAIENALHGQGAMLAKVSFALEEASATGPLAGRLARDQLNIAIIKEELESFREQFKAEISSLRADYTILKGIAAQAVEDKATERLKVDRKLQIDLENTKGKWIVIGLIVTNLFTLLALLLKQ